MSNTTDDRLVATSVALTPDQAKRSLEIANAQGISRSSWFRNVIDAELSRADLEHPHD